ncbi:Cadherin [Halocaridina rubra]|uniref:Cadherin n=1 Tax=Halocaridina rubra TaxID=373956 RepID=A0AAN8XFX9_HALRR
MPRPGEIRTAICCLDRERTPGYSIQVVAIDGGGLTGTSSASIKILDVNDSPPRFTKNHWLVEVQEGDPSSIPSQSILNITVIDEDETNDFHFDIVNATENILEMFQIESDEHGVGFLKLLKSLDYEDPDHRSGFIFQIRVSDGQRDQSERDHVAYSWVQVIVIDVNDNEPQFVENKIQISVSENVEVGTKFCKFTATDIDRGGKSRIDYSIDISTDRFGQFSIDKIGTVILQKQLDRELHHHHVLSILSFDDGTPPRTSTATLTINVMDENDKAPRFLKNYQPTVQENQQPSKVLELQAEDDDDPAKGNGPPFFFSLDSSASWDIRTCFRLDFDKNGGNGVGTAIVSTQCSLDREVQKEYHLPIFIKDSGVPPMSSTCTLTIVVGDENDNIMQPGEKEIFVYIHQKVPPESEIGRVYVQDPDDWDLADKSFSWAAKPHPNFSLNRETGMITMKHATEEGKYQLQFKVQDYKHFQRSVLGSVSIGVRYISQDTLLRAGSLRILKLSEEDFIRTWDYKTKQAVSSKAFLFIEKVSNLLSTNTENVVIISVVSKQTQPVVTDIRFIVNNDTCNDPVLLNGLIIKHKSEIEKYVGVYIVMVDINECLYENVPCDGSCSGVISISSVPYLVDANRTSLVGVSFTTVAECTCKARTFSQEETCHPNPCYNSGFCTRTKSRVKCKCSKDFDGPRCQSLSRTFKGNSFAWFPSLKACDRNHLSLEFLTLQLEGLILYNGAMVISQTSGQPTSDLIMLELREGRLNYHIDYGSGTLELQVNTTSTLNDGRWHHIDLFWDNKIARINVDYCTEDFAQNYNSTGKLNTHRCETSGMIVPPNKYLNVNGPLQLGGLGYRSLEATFGERNDQLHKKSLIGCVRNVKMNGLLYDLAHPALHKNTMKGCTLFENVCKNHISSSFPGCGHHGHCEGTIQNPVCICHPGWTGSRCDRPTISAYFEDDSYIKYTLSLPLNAFSTKIQLRFRTWQENGLLLRISDHRNGKYAVLEIDQGYMSCRLKSLEQGESHLILSKVIVNDGDWHIVHVIHYGFHTSLSLDGGEGRRCNESYGFSNSNTVNTNKEEGLYVGGTVEHFDYTTFRVHNDFKQGNTLSLRSIFS